MGAVAFLAPVPRDRALDAAMDLGHAPIFAIAAIWALPRLKRAGVRRLVFVVLLLSAVIGGLIEGAQSLTGRDASFLDAADDVAGGLAGLLLGEAYAMRRHRAALAIGGMVALALPSAFPALRLSDCLEQRASLPLLSSFEHWIETDRWDATDCQFGRSAEHATLGRFSLRVELLPASYPGIGLVWPPPDWSGYGRLRFDVFVEGATPLDLRLKIEDQAHNGELTDRFQRVLHLLPGPHEIDIPLSDVEQGPEGRRLDLRHIGQMRLFAVDLRERRVFFLDDVRLVSGVAGHSPERTVPSRASNLSAGLPLDSIFTVDRVQCRPYDRDPNLSRTG